MIKPIVDKKFIVNLKGKEFIKYEGLLDMGHQIGLKSIQTNIIQIPDKDNEMTCIVKASITTNDNEEFHGIGDASPISVTNMLVPSIIRMAETRAKARALRDLTNIGMTAVDELGDDIEVDYKSKYFNQPRSNPQSNRQQNYNTQQKQPNQPNNIVGQCSVCGVGITEKIIKFSQSKYGKPLCFKCQNQ